MSVLERSSRKRMYLGQDGNNLTRLILFLAIIFVLFKFVYIIFRIIDLTDDQYFTHIHDWARLPSSPEKLMLKPWTIISYMFLHFKIWHFLGNLLWLWGFGYIFQDLIGNKRLVPVFIYGGVAGAVAFLLSYNLFPLFKPLADVATLEGASAGVMAIAIATTAMAPNYRLFPMIYGGIPLWVFTIVFVLIDFASIPSVNAGGHIAHLAGGAMGLLFSWQLKKGNDWAVWMNRLSDWAGNLFNPEKSGPRRISKEEMFYKAKGQPYKKIPHVTPQRIDAILDKINQYGFDHLTEEAKEILRRASESE
ncbi:MAG TPA: rhomboid family intramembrane serine protease [Parasegetibacter sp.]